MEIHLRKLYKIVSQAVQIRVLLRQRNKGLEFL